MFFTLLLLCAASASRRIRDTSYGSVSSYLLDRYKNYNGTFIDIGCNGGVYSNTYMLERTGWNGFCVKRTLRRRMNAITYRGSICLSGMKATDVVFKVKTLNDGDVMRIYEEEHDRIYEEHHEKEGEEEETSTQAILCYDLQKLRKLHGFVNVTYMSIDTGGNELELLSMYRPLDWVEWVQARCVTIQTCLELLQVLIHDGFSMVRFIQFNSNGGSLLVKHK